MEHFKSKTRTIEVLNPNTVRIQYLDNVFIELDDAIKDYAIYDEITERKPFKKLVLSGRFTNITPEARKYVQQENEKRGDIILAEALVLKSLPERMFARVYFSFLSQVYPLKIFNTEEEAIAWLNQI